MYLTQAKEPVFFTSHYLRVKVPPLLYHKTIQELVQLLLCDPQNLHTNQHYSQALKFHPI